MENWIRRKYEKKQFVAKSLPAFAKEDVDLSQPISVLLGGRLPAKKKAETSGLGIKLKAPTSVTAPAPAPAPAATAPAPAPAAKKDAGIDLLGFDCFETTPATPPVTAAPKSSSTTTSLEADFALFGVSSAASAPTTAAPAPAHAFSGADILGMYGTPAPAPQVHHAAPGMTVSAAFGPGPTAPNPYGMPYGQPQGYPQAPAMPGYPGYPPAGPAAGYPGYPPAAQPTGYAGYPPAYGYGAGMAQTPAGMPPTYVGAGAMPVTATPTAGAHNPFAAPATASGRSSFTEKSHVPVAASRDPFADLGGFS